MKHLVSSGLMLGLLLTGSQARAQTYDQLLEGAARQLGQKNYCEASAAFVQAFADTTKAGPFDLYAGAGAAANCPGQQAQALRWLLRLSRQANVPITARDVDQMAQDPGLSSLHGFPQWFYFLSQLRQTAARRAAEAQRAAAAWQQAALSQALPASPKSGSYAAVQPGFALYYAPVDTVRVPYLVYVPKTYQPTRPTALLVYLHGGITSTPQFRSANPGVTQEPIFAAAAEQNALVLYPFGRQSFGWLEQRAALENVRTMVEQVKQRYHVDSRRVFLGGMSNGGTAAFWYACQSPAGFAGFYALSARPISALGPLNFKQLRRGAPLYSLHAQDDDVFAYQEVRATYEQQQGQARQWHFLSRPTGGHSFLYGPDGPAALRTLLAQLMQPPVPTKAH
ncbi:dienelactone hydrolase family protein [Hymenobacter cellulosivorans]|uniref:Dienelactone hydrolase family protein n=1 Tax=Hymenobacter cellulosivorans TaxID=2932249 RepID=A0ABY4F3I0_9BACT|nr:dienelactone hydrolase family protein [Hymenobacter cellulosivorans]UOQ51218.1 dienelactone hydrolase family protein [Hymenobacter cellulosivorans]